MCYIDVFSVIVVAYCLEVGFCFHIDNYMHVFLCFIMKLGLFHVSQQVIHSQLKNKQDK